MIYYANTPIYSLLAADSDYELSFACTHFTYGPVPRFYNLRKKSVYAKADVLRLSEIRQYKESKELSLQEFQSLIAGRHSDQMSLDLFAGKLEFPE